MVEVDVMDTHMYVRFNYTKKRMDTIKTIPGYKTVTDPKDPDGLAFRFPLDFEIAKIIRQRFGDELTMTKECRKWAKELSARTDKLAKMSSADTAELERLPRVLPKLHNLMLSRPFQLADVAYMAAAPACINANEPGSGKTVEIMGTVFEAALDAGPNLIIGPVSSLETVWREHLTGFDQPHPVLVAPPGPENRIRIMQEAMALDEAGEPFWLVVNPAMVTLISSFDREGCEDHDGKKVAKHLLRECPICQEVRFPQYPELEFINWNTKVMDEFHLAGLGNPDSLTYKGFKKIPAKKTIATSGTPIGGKPIKLYGILSCLYPKDFTSKWRFAEQWLVVTEEYVSEKNKVKRVEGLRKDREEDFWRMMSSYMLRRTMEEIAPDMPPINVIDMWVEMTPKQEAQYREFEAEAEIRIDEYQLGAIGVLAEYARLKQFANAEQRVEVIPSTDPEKPDKLILQPTENSSKLPVIEMLLGERGITPDEDWVEGPGVIISSESERMVKMVHGYLTRKGYACGLITGPVKGKDRDAAVRDFQAGKQRVMCLTTTAGGVAITLDKANTVILLDETWNPDDQVQVIGRGRRLSRIQQVTAIYIRSKGTIQHAIQMKVEDKAEINRRVIDFRKEGLFRV
jgi:hypothetical protein